MTRQYLIRPRAERDIWSAFEWYESQRAGLGEAFLASLHEKLSAVRDFPDANPVVYKNVRRAVVSRFPYLIFYVVSAAHITVLAVLHHARNPAGWPRG